jgi:hypothetical protein
MLWFLLQTLWLILPIVGACFIHIAVLRHGWFPWLKIPVDGGRQLAGKRIFGDHKTIRGFVVTMGGTALFLWIQTVLAHWSPAVAALGFVDYRTISPWIDGLVYGAGYSLGELPNSFAKRRLGIGEGQKGGGAVGRFFLFLDQVDGIFGFLLTMCIFHVPTWQVAVTVFVMFTVIHVAVFNVILVLLGVKKRIF